MANKQLTTNHEQLPGDTSVLDVQNQRSCVELFLWYYCDSKVITMTPEQKQFEQIKLIEAKKAFETIVETRKKLRKLGYDAVPPDFRGMTLGRLINVAEDFEAMLGIVKKVKGIKDDENEKDKKEGGQSQNEKSEGLGLTEQKIKPVEETLPNAPLVRLDLLESVPYEIRPFKTEGEGELPRVDSFEQIAELIDMSHVEDDQESPLRNVVDEAKNMAEFFHILIECAEHFRKENEKALGGLASKKTINS